MQYSFDKEQLQKTEYLCKTQETRIKLSCRVLLVDDVPLNLKVMEAMLRKLGIEPVTARNGVEALTRLAEQPFDFVLTDLWMPIMNGVELAQKIRQNPQWGILPIAVITADTECGINFDMSMFDEILSKPVSLDKMASFLKKKKGAHA